jgi:hypothetical protein
MWTQSQASACRRNDIYIQNAYTTSSDANTYINKLAWSMLTSKDQVQIQLWTGEVMSSIVALRQNHMLLQERIQPSSKYYMHRAKMDFTWFPTYPSVRVAFQDELIEKMIHRGAPQQNPIAMFTSGIFGAGKTHYINHNFNLKQCVRIDPDEIRRQLPEWDQLVRDHPKDAGTLTHMESTFIALLVERICIANKYNYLVDGSLSNLEWYKTWLLEVKQTHRLYLFRFSCSLELAFERCLKREQMTGRHVSEQQIRDTLAKIEIAWPQLKMLADVFWWIDTEKNVILFSSFFL